MLAISYLVTLVTSDNELNFLCEIPHFEPYLRIRIYKSDYYDHLLRLNLLPIMYIFELSDIVFAQVSESSK